MEIKVMKRVLDRNRDMASRVRKLLESRNVCMVNMISSPGAGKTSLLEHICERLAGKVRIAVIEGDVATDRDAQRLKKYGVPIVLINTEGGCHLDSNSIDIALKEFNLDELDVIFVENVGNLVCPSHFDLGETFKLALVSTTEGDDKPIKYPMLFREARAVVLNKTDLLPYTDFDIKSFNDDLKQVNSTIPLFKISCRMDNGLDDLMEWIKLSVRNC
ncbi:MAG: hydrogenase nickel incorporation protein HypB [Bacteroidales bacterium]